MSKHEIIPERELQEITSRIVNAHYSSVVRFLELFSKKINAQAKINEEQGKPYLSNLLCLCVLALEPVIKIFKLVKKLCESKMKKTSR